MKSIIYTGPFPQLDVEIGRGSYVTAQKGKPVSVPDPIAEELIARGDFIPAKAER